MTPSRSKLPVWFDLVDERAESMEKIPPELIGRAIQDPDFRRQLLADPENAVRDSGYEFDQDQIEALRDLDPKAIDEAIEALTGDLDGAKWG